MRKIFLLIIILLSGKFVSAQVPVMYDMSTQDAFSFRYVEYDGSPLLYDDWKVGKIKLKDGKVFSDYQLNYDIPANLLLFKDKDGSIRKFTVSVHEFSLGNEVFRSGYNPSENRNSAAFYQVLADGKVQYLKWVDKTITEDKPYGASSMKKRFTNLQYYFVARDGKLQKIRRDKKSVIEAIGDKAPELEKYVAQEKLNLKTDEGIAALITYYNSL